MAGIPGTGVSYGTEPTSYDIVDGTDGMKSCGALLLSLSVVVIMGLYE